MRSSSSRFDFPLRMVVDTNVWLDMLVFADQAAAAIRDQALASRLQLVTCDQTRAEWQCVLDYPRLALASGQKQSLLDAYDALAFPLALPERCADESMEGGITLPRCRDPDDQVFLELAFCAGADWLLTRDKALLVLDRRCRRIAGFSVQRPDDWLAAAGRALA